FAFRNLLTGMMHTRLVYLVAILCDLNVEQLIGRLASLIARHSPNCIQGKINAKVPNFAASK
ncbi:hypothetical protein, partial [Nostoc sp.]|uniref:hypothetical protein n=1 Tax=Nostoc sp. TaxID=1180 RepID=UPI002FF6C0B8